LIPGEALPVIDPEAGTITFMAQGSGFGGPVDLIMFNRSTFQEVGRFRVGNVSGAADTLIRWGGKGNGIPDR